MLLDYYPYFGMGLFMICAWLLANPILTIWDNFCTSYIEDLSQMLSKLQIDSGSLVFYERLWGILILGTIVVVGFYAGMWPIVFTIICLLYLSPRIILQTLIRQQQTLLRDQLLPSLSVIANSVRAGMTIEAAFEAAADETPDPLAREFKRIVGEYQHGRSFIDTVNDAKHRLLLPSFTLFAASIITNKKRGGDISETIERLRKSLLENQRLERKLEADTATGVMVINLLSLFPLGFLFFAYLMNPDGTTLLLTTFVGQLILCLVIVLVAVGYRIGMKIMNIDF
jgi:tight adherence protein B